MTRAAWILLGAALALWFAFDRIWPRLPPGPFARLELGLLVAAGGAAALGLRRERTRSAAGALGAALTGLGIWLAVALLGLRYTP